MVYGGTFAPRNLGMLRKDAVHDNHFYKHGSVWHRPLQINFHDHGTFAPRNLGVLRKDAVPYSHFHDHGTPSPAIMEFTFFQAIQ